MPTMKTRTPTPTPDRLQKAADIYVALSNQNNHQQFDDDYCDRHAHAMPTALVTRAFENGRLLAHDLL